MREIWGKQMMSHIALPNVLYYLCKQIIMVRMYMVCTSLPLVSGKIGTSTSRYCYRYKGVHTIIIPGTVYIIRISDPHTHVQQRGQVVYITLHHAAGHQTKLFCPCSPVRCWAIVYTHTHTTVKLTAKLAVTI